MIAVVIVCLICFCIGVFTGVMVCEANAEKTVDRIMKEKKERDKEGLT